MNFLKSKRTILILLLIQLVVAAIFYAILPAEVAIHWKGLPGVSEADRYASKIIAVLLWPVITLGYYLLSKGRNTDLTKLNMTIMLFNCLQVITLILGYVFSTPQ